MNLRNALVTLIVLLGALIAEGSERFPDWLQPCGPQAPDALCGTLEVSENRDAEGGRHVGLFVLVLPAIGSGPYAPPIVPLAGGPGQAASDGAGFARNVFGPLREKRDIVLLDQRGTGRSNKLDCGVFPADTRLQAYFDDFPSVGFVRDCLAKQKGDVTRYTTHEAVRDLEELRKKLGYDQLSLVGGSYGTRVALHYMRLHPSRVSSAILDGVSPPGRQHVAQFAPAFEKTLAHLFERCAADPACAATYPELASAWTAALGQFETGVLTIVARHPETGNEEPLTFSRGLFVDGVRRMLYRAHGWQQAAGVITAAAAGDFTGFVEARYRTQSGLLRELSWGMLLAISCSESVPFGSDDQIRKTTAGTSLGDYRARTIKQACAEWRAGKVPAGWSSPVSVDTPVLILSGAVDPATPPWVAAEVAQRLPNSLHLVGTHRSHAPTDFACENRIMQAFLESANVKDLDTSCFAEVEWPSLVPTPEPALAAAMDAEAALAYVGSYELQPGFVLEITVDDDRMFIKPPGEPKRALRPEGEDVFVVQEFGLRLEFKKDADGVVQGFQLQDGSSAKKVE